VSQLLFPAYPVRLVRQRFDPFAQELADVCELLAAGAERRDGERVTSAVESIAAIGDVRIEEVLDAARVTASRAPRRRRQRRRIDGYAHAAVELEAASNDLLLLAKTLQRLQAEGAAAGDVAPSLRRLGRVIAVLPTGLAAGVPAENLAATVAGARELARAARGDSEAPTGRVVENDLLAFADDVARAVAATRMP
jgi:hypothetical protein